MRGRAEIGARGMGNDKTISPTGKSPAAQRTGIAIGARNGTSDSAMAKAELGSAGNAKVLQMNESTSSHATGCCAWRASCSLEEMAPTAANIAEYKKNPPRK